MDWDKNKRQQRFRNKNRRDTNKHGTQIDREKVKPKTYRPRIDYDPSLMEEDPYEEWAHYEFE